MVSVEQEFRKGTARMAYLFNNVRDVDENGIIPKVSPQSDLVINF